MCPINDQNHQIALISCTIHKQKLFDIDLFYWTFDLESPIIRIILAFHIFQPTVKYDHHQTFLYIWLIHRGILYSPMNLHFNKSNKKISTQLPLRHRKTYECASNSCVIFFLAWVKSVRNFTLFCHKNELYCSFAACRAITMAFKFVNC